MASASEIKKAGLISNKYEEGDEIIKSFTEPDLFIYRKKNIHSAFLDGVPLKGGSKFKDNFLEPFKDSIAYGLAKYWKVTGQQILKLWRDKGNITSLFGTAVHKIRENVDLGRGYEEDKEEIIRVIKKARKLYEDNKAVGETIMQNKKGCEDNYALPTHKDITKMMNMSDNEIRLYVDVMEEEFQILERRLGFHEYECEPEVYVTYSPLKMGGEIDKLIIIDREKKICRVQDNKVQGDVTEISSTNKMINELAKKKASKLDIIRIQLSYYAFCLWKAGWTVEGASVYSRDGSWENHSVDLIPMEEMEKLLIKYL
jgi:hypothetical protein